MECYIRKISYTFLLATFAMACAKEESEKLKNEGPPPPPPKIEVTANGIKATAQKNLATALRALASTEDMGSEMDFIKELDMQITRDDCEPKEEPGMGEPMPCEQRPAAERADEMAQTMVDEMFKSEYLETEEAKRLVYKAEIGCDESEEMLPEPTEPAPEPTEKCEPTELRFEFTSVREGDLDVDILVGADKLKALSIQLYESSASVTADLFDVQTLLQKMEVETSTEGPSLPDTMSGVISAGISNPGTGTYVASFSIVKAIEIASTQTGSEYRIQIGTANPAGSLTIDEMAKSVVGALDMNVIDLELFSGIADIEGVKDGKVNFHIGGFGGSVTLAESGEKDQIQINDINMGEESTYLAFDGQRLVTIDLNETAERKFSLTADMKEESLQLGFAPSFDLKVNLDLDSIIDQNSEETLPVWLTNETFQVTVDGASLPSILVMNLGGEEEAEPVSPDPGGQPSMPPQEPEEDEGPDSFLKVVDGLLTLKAVKAQKEVRVSAGQCLNAGEEQEEPSMGEMMPESEHPFDFFSAGTCIQ